MTTVWQTSGQQYNNRTVENTVPVTLAPCRVQFVMETTAVANGASAVCRADFLTGTSVVHGLRTDIPTTGQCAVGSRLPAGVTHLRLRLDVTGRMTMAFRIVTFDILEDVLETF